MLSSLNQLMLKRPRLASGVAGGFLGGCGDLAAQQLERLYQPDSDSTRRALEPARTALVGSFYCGAAAGFYFPFYAWMDVAFGRSGWRAVAGKVCADNFVALPFEIPMFYACTVAPRSGSTAALARLREDFVPTLLAGWLLWIPTSTVVFAWVAPHLRIPVFYVIDASWACALSFLSNREPSSPRPAGVPGPR